MQIVNKKLSEIKPYANNPRNNDGAVDYVVNSIKEFGFKVPVIIDRNGEIVAGHTRYKAAKKLKMEEMPCIVADDLTEEQIKAFRLADNKVAEIAEWDFELLYSELDEIIDFDMGNFGFELNDESENEMYDKTDGPTLADKFVVPPFSVFDTRQGYWQSRKEEWKELGIQSELGRDVALLGEGLNDLSEKMGSKTRAGTSVFDPVLCEIVYKWFCVEGGSVYDCFAGGSVRGITAAKLGYKYKGLDLRQEQIDANYENASNLSLEIEWYCDDSLNADKYVDDDSVDLVFSCPPYADLEVYSNDPRDISTMNYDNFIATYRKIIEVALRKLKNDRFAVFVVGDVRDKKGFYYDFISDTKKAFIDCGCKLYNEIILVEQIGVAALKAGRQFTAGRKVVKVHQNVLVFYKGNPKNIKENYTMIDVKETIKEAIEE